MKKPVAVIINDIHYNINTLEVADKAMNMAIDKANELEVALVVAGDLHDTKANIRGECIKRMLATFSRCKTTPYVIVGNHCRINEKSIEHSLEFLNRYAHIVDVAATTHFTPDDVKTYLIAYHHYVEELRAYLKTIPKGSRLIMHQGIEGSNAGHYIQDKSALNHKDVADFRVLSGHYHRRQDIKTGRPRKGAVGLWTYLGNPYTLGFGEANDPEKGFNILYDDGLTEFVPTNLRKHVIHETDSTHLSLVACPKVNSEDLLWIKIKGTKEYLSELNKKYVASVAGLPDGFNFKLDLVPNESKATLSEENVAKQSQPELLDGLIASLTNVSEEQKKRLQTIWKDLCES